MKGYFCFHEIPFNVITAKTDIETDNFHSLQYSKSIHIIDRL